MAAGVLSAAEAFEGSDQTRLVQNQGGIGIGIGTKTTRGGAGDGGGGGCPSQAEGARRARQRVEAAQQVISATADVVDGESGGSGGMVSRQDPKRAVRCVGRETGWGDRGGGGVRVSFVASRFNANLPSETDRLHSSFSSSSSSSSPERT